MILAFDSVTALALHELYAAAIQVYKECVATAHRVVSIMAPNNGESLNNGTVGSSAIRAKCALTCHEQSGKVVFISLSQSCQRIPIL